jgi:parallel beta-helix repeat protein
VLNSTVGNGFNISGSGCRVENNSAIGNASSGFDLQAGTNNLIVKNIAQRNIQGDFSLDNNQFIGPIITTTGIITNSNPWANFSR